MADGASLARRALSSPSGFDNLWVMHVGVPVPAPGRGQCMVGVEPGLDLEVVRPWSGERPARVY